MLTTRLHGWHLAGGAKMAPFAGYEMPISYPTGAIEEHLICRRSVGLFDIDHMGQVELSGPGADAFVSGLVSARVLDMGEGDARYSLLLDEKGLVLDDLFIYRLPKRWWIVVNASNRESDLKWMRARAPKDVIVDDRSDDTYMIAVQGPRAIELLDAVAEKTAGGGAVSSLERFTAGEISVGGTKVLFGRTGYTGEDGGELFFPADRALEVWELLLSEGRKRGIETAPIGLAARDSLRFEAGMPLHGHEISPAINPIEAGFKWACDFAKEFVGKEALEAVVATGPRRRLVALDVTGGVPREGCEVFAPVVASPSGGSDSVVFGAKVGICVAGMFCPSVKKYAANAFVAPELSKIGTALAVSIRDKPRDALVVKRPLYVPAYRR
ncbi:MAG: glycine cleavage system aminomethyltransferase GcvT [Rectinemataceae bacterium]